MKNNNIKPYFWFTKNTDNVFKDCDCACETQYLKKMKVPDTKNEIHKATSDILEISDDRFAVWNRNYSTGIKVLNKIALDFINNVNILKLNNDNLDFLYQNNFVESKNYVTEIANDTLSIWLQMTNKCNLNCSYCYVKQSSENLSVETGIKIIDTIFEKAVKYDYKTVKLKFSGGEPLLNIDLLLQLNQYASHLSKRLNLKLKSIVLSNGLLITEEIINKLNSQNISLMISIDGFKVYNRVGKTNYKIEKLFEVIEKCKDAGLLQNISITVTDNNIVDLPEFVDYCLKKELPFVFNFYRPNDLLNDKLIISDDKFIFYLKKAYKIIENNLPNRNLLSVLLDKVNLLSTHKFTCDAGKDYLVFNTKGQNLNCQMELTDNKINENFINPSIDQKMECSNCEIKYFCSGGCPILSNSSEQQKSPYCNIYKALYKDVIRLEALRLLKYEKPYLIENKEIIE